jgi:ABC-2 type transport system permease protein
MSDHGPTERGRLGGLRHSAEITAVHLRVTAHNELQYRTNFYMQLLQTAWQVVGGLVVVALVYSKTPELNGWRRGELLAAVGVFTMIGGLLRSVVFPPLQQMMEDVAQGDFDHTLTQPADPQLLVSVRGIDVWQLTDVVVGAIIVAVAIPDLPSGLSADDAAAFVLLLAAGAAITYWMWLSLSCLAFWVTRLPFMDNLMHYVTRAAQYPISIYPAWLRISMTVIVPLGIAVTAPAEAVSSRLTWETAASALTVAAVLGVFSRWLWNRALRRYSGASA